jgi:hypothetical protein
MKATQQSPGGFEERLLAELRRVVAEGPGPAAAQPAAQPSPARPTPLWRRRRLAVAGGLAAVAAAATIAGVSLGGHQSAAWAVTPNGDGTVTVKIHSLADAAGLQRQLNEAGVRSLVQYLPPGKTCADGELSPPPGAFTQSGGDPSAPPRGAIAQGGHSITQSGPGGEYGLQQAAPPGAPDKGSSDKGLQSAGAPPSGNARQGMATIGVRHESDGSIEFTVKAGTSSGQTLVIRNQELAPGQLPGGQASGAPQGGTAAEGSAISVTVVQGKARPCKVVDAPQ